MKKAEKTTEKKILKKPEKKKSKVVLYQESLGAHCNCGCEHGA